VISRLVEYPWRRLERFREIASNHPQGLIDLSIGSPIDPTPELIQLALAEATNNPGYPKTAGSAELKAAVVNWFSRRRGVPALDVQQILPTVGSKEFISLLPLMLGLGEGDAVVQPSVAYTAYAVGANLVGSQLVSSDNPADWPSNTKLIWLNSPSNPTGAVLSPVRLRLAVERARELGAVVVNDECYAELAWEDPWRSSGIPSILDPAVVRGDFSGVLAIYSLSKVANLAGYRLGLAAGDANLIADLLNTRMHAGLMLPGPMQAAMTAALANDDYLSAVRSSYLERRVLLSAAFSRAGYQIESSEAGLYLWLRSTEASWEAIAKLAEAGVLVAPGDFYSAEASNHLRVALTVSTEQARAVSERLSVF
jgi:succinyldiaminopimelate transaminase